MRKRFNVEGMTCAACQAHVQKAVEKVNGTSYVNVNLLQNNMDVEFDENICTISTIEKAVSDAGYKAYIPGDTKTSNSKEVTSNEDSSLKDLIVAIIILLVLMYFSMGNMMWNWPSPKVFDHHHNPAGFALIQFILVLPILYIYRRYFISGYKKLFNGSANMDTLICVGATASMIYSIYCTFMITLGYVEYHMYLYYEAAGMILVFVSIGKYLESLSKKRTTDAITKLYDLSPKKAILFKDGKEVEILSEDVKVDDILVIKKGMAIAVDGVIVEGNGSIDQANITGESIPVYKKANDEVYSSTIVTAGYFKMRATKVGEDTSIANIIKLVEEASNSKAPISKLADKISGIFVPTILIIALIVFIANMVYISIANPSYVSNSFETALNFAITVVVIACPCALGLATPVAIMVGTGKGAENGLLIRNAEILEKAHLIKTVVLDKTGTITLGKPIVNDLIKYTDDNIEDILYSLEAKSEHPLANAIVRYCRQNKAKKLAVDDFNAVEAMGVSGTINNDTYKIGNRNAIEIVPEKVGDSLDEFASQGKTPLLIVKNDNVIGIITVSDPVKNSSVEAIKSLRDNGIRVVMLTGDNKKTAQAISKVVGVDEVISDVLPTDKAKVIESLKSDDKHLVAMVGDGVNDALALTTADLGIAIGAGSDIALESSDIVLLRNNLLDVDNVIKLSSLVLTKIKMGLFWAFFYNIICVFLATGLLYYITNGSFKMEPMYGSIAMSISSVSVVLNALTINFFKVKKSNIENYDDEEDLQEEEEMETLEIKVTGMMCQMCVKHVRNACLSVSGVETAEPSLENNNVVVTGNGLDKAAIVKAIVEEGYEAE